MVAQVDKEYANYGYGKLIRRLISYTLFEGRPHTTKGQWFNPVVFFILRILTALPGCPKLKQPIFITGLGRSGTTILGILLSLHEDVGFLNEPKAIWRIIDPKHDINGDYVSSGGIFRLKKDATNEHARKTAHRIFGRYLSIVQAKRLVDKYPELIFRVEYLLALFPDAKIIFISRNGVDATHSIALWSKRLGVEVNGRVDDWWGRGDIKWTYLREQIILQDADYTSVREVANEDLDHVNRAALEWIITMREGLKCLREHPDSIIHVQYEKLTVSPEIEISRLLKQCNLSQDSAVISHAKKKLYKNKLKKKPNLLAPIQILFDETMAELGHSSEEE
ncbi:MAG TPA: sulfotransferase [Gammaproteobacteria bacterium]|nr:sulfotransferase [Gammaproteobacteria bacterium]